MSIIVYGQYPRSEALVKATRDYDRKRVSEEALQSIFQEDRIALKKLQEGLHYHTSGLLHWEDLMRPFTHLVENCQAGPLTRFFETNTFWRRLELDGPFRVKEESIDQWFKKYFYPNDIYSSEDSMVFTLPFIFLFQAFSKGMSMENIRSLLQKVVSHIDKNYRGMIVFFEPNIGWNPLSNDEKKQARIFLEEVKSQTTIPLAIVQCFSSVEREKEFLFSLPVDMIGIDFYSNRLNSISKGFPEDKSLLAGVISTESTMLEEKEHIAAFMEHAAEFLPTDNIFITVSGPAELLPKEIMDQKLIHMKEVLQWSLSR